MVNNSLLIVLQLVKTHHTKSKHNVIKKLEGQFKQILMLFISNNFLRLVTTLHLMLTTNVMADACIYRKWMAVKYFTICKVIRNYS